MNYIIISKKKLNKQLDIVHDHLKDSKPSTYDHGVIRGEERILERLLGNTKDMLSETYLGKPHTANVGPIQYWILFYLVPKFMRSLPIIRKYYWQQDQLDLVYDNVEEFEKEIERTVKKCL